MGGITQKGGVSARESITNMDRFYAELSVERGLKVVFE